MTVQGQYGCVLAALLVCLALTIGFVGSPAGRRSPPRPGRRHPVPHLGRPHLGPQELQRATAGADGDRPRGCCRAARDGRLDRGPGSPVQQARLRRASTHPDDPGPPAELRIVDPTGPGARSRLPRRRWRKPTRDASSLWVADEATRTVELRGCSDAAIGAGHPNPRLSPTVRGVAGWVTLHDEPIKADDLSRTPMIARSGTRPTASGACTRCRSCIRTPWLESSCSWASSPSTSRTRNTRSSRP